MIGILGWEYKLKIDVLIELSIHSALKTYIHILAWTARVSRDLVQSFIAFNFDPTTCSQCPPHRWISYRHTEVLLTFLWHKSLIQWPWLRRLRTSVLIIDNIIRCIITTTTIVISIKPIINPIIIIIFMPKLLVVMIEHLMTWVEYAHLI